MRRIVNKDWRAVAETLGQRQVDLIGDDPVGLIDQHTAVLYRGPAAPMAVHLQRRGEMSTARAQSLGQSAVIDLYALRVVADGFAGVELAR